MNSGVEDIQSISAAHVGFDISGLDTDDSGTLTFTDGTNTVVVTISDGAVVAGANNTTTTVNLSGLKDDTTITSTLALTDTAGNSFSASGNDVMVERHDSVTITGAPAVGQAVIATVEDVDDNSTSGFSYQWNLDGVAISGATSAIFAITSADVGHALTVTVTEGGETFTSTAVTAVSTQRFWKNDGVAGTKDWQNVQGAWNAPSNTVPNANDDVFFSTADSKPYTVTISTSGSLIDVAHSLTVLDSQATILDTTGGDLSLNGGAGGMTIANGVFELWGGSLEAQTIYIRSGGTFSTEGNYILTETIWDDGLIDVASGSLEIAGFATGGSTGKFKIEAGATLRLDTAESLNVLFAAATGLLVLSDPALFTGTISASGGSLQAGDVIDVSGFDTGASINYLGTTSGGTVTISEAGHTSVTLNVGANSMDWAITGLDSSGTGILIHDPVPPSASSVASNPAPVTDNAGILTVSDGTVLPLDGVIENSGTIALDSTGHQTELQVSNDVMLQGGGDIVMSGGQIVAAGPASTLTNVDETISGYGQIGSGTGDLTFINDGTVNADVSGHALTIDTGSTVANDGALEASSGGILIIGDPVIGTGSALIEGGTLVFEASSTINVTFEDGGSGATYGELVLADAPNFSGHIFGFSGNEAGANQSDAIDLVGFTYGSTLYSESISNGNMLLTATDGSTVAVLTFDNFGGVLDFASDGKGGSIITDSSASSPFTVEGSIVLNDSGMVDTSVTPDGSDYVGSFSLDIPKEADGTTTVGFAFALGGAQPSLAPGETSTQSYTVSVADAQDPALSQNSTISVSIGGPGADNFVFAPGIGDDTIANFNPQQDSIEFDHFANVQTIQELQSLITADAHGDAVIDLGHHDSVTLQGVTTQQLQQVVQAGQVLLH